MDGQTRLVERILAGEVDAFKALIADYGRLVNHIVYRMIPNRSDREDICQDIFLKVYQNLAAFRADARLSTWIGRIATNHCLDSLGKKSLPLADDVFEDAVENTPGINRSPHQDAEEADISILLRAEIDELPAVFRTIITLYHLDELSYLEIGQTMDLPEGTVKSYLFRARQMLKERLSAKYGKEELWQ